MQNDTLSMYAYVAFITKVTVWLEKYQNQPSVVQVILYDPHKFLEKSSTCGPPPPGQEYLNDPVVLYIET